MKESVRGRSIKTKSVFMALLICVVCIYAGSVMIITSWQTANLQASIEANVAAAEEESMLVGDSNGPLETYHRSLYEAFSAQAEEKKEKLSALQSSNNPVIAWVSSQNTNMPVIGIGCAIMIVPTLFCIALLWAKLTSNKS